MNNQDQKPQISRMVRKERSRVRKYDPEAWKRAHQQKLQLPSFKPFEFHLSAELKSKIRAAKTPMVLALDSWDGKKLRTAASVKVTSTKNPAPEASLGYVGSAIKLESKKRFFLALLTFPIVSKHLRAIAPETIRVFRWHGPERGFEPVVPGGLADGYAWARVSSPGIYILIGLPADPFKQTLIRMTSTMAPMLVGMNKRDRATLLRSVEKALTNQTWFKSFGPKTMQHMFRQGWTPSPDFGFGFGGFPSDPGSDQGKSLPEKPDWAGWDPDDVHVLGGRMPLTGWPERWLIPMTDYSWLFPPGGFDFGWMHQGPTNIPGHSTEVHIDPGDHNRLYTSTENGGIWVLDDVSRYPAGSRWRPLTDFNRNLDTWCMAIAPSNNQVLYYADGGNGPGGWLFRSEDRGLTWVQISDTPVLRAKRIIVHPRDADTVYVAAESGFYRHTTGSRVMDRLYTGAVTDAVMDHEDSQIIYLGIRRVGIVKTTTAGTGPSPWSVVFDWRNASAPTGTEIRLALGRQRSAATRTVVARFDQEVFVNKNGGVAATGSTGWSSKGKRGGDGNVWWCFALGVSPHDDRFILAGSQDLFRTATGGTPPRSGRGTWTKVGGYDTPVHADFWHITFDPTQPGVVYCANDGGVYRSTDNGSTWQYLENSLASAQLYETGINGGRAVSGMYHQGIVASNDISTRQWETIVWGLWEFSQIYGDPKRPNYYYVFGVNAYTGEIIALHRRRWPNTLTGENFNLGWGAFKVTSIGIDPSPGSNIILCGARDPATLKRTRSANTPMSATPRWTNESIELVADEIVTAIAFAPSRPGMAYVITNQGRLFRKWDVSSPSDWRLVSTWARHQPISLAVDPNDDQRVYAITANEIGMLDGAGSLWSVITGSAGYALPTDSTYVEVITHPRTSGVVIVALQIGVFITVDNGNTWNNYDHGTVVGWSLPNAAIVDINWSGDSLYAACHGRGLWRRQVVL